MFYRLKTLDRFSSTQQLSMRKRLLKKKEVSTVVNACDAGREGELIFRYLIELAAPTRELQLQRMWMQSMKH